MELRQCRCSITFSRSLSERRHWHSFHNAWATYLSSQLSALLPAGYFAEPNVQFGIEIDVAACEEGDAGAPLSQWTPPPAQSSVPFQMLGSIVEIGIFSRSGGPQLVGAVELVSPSNKDRPAHREALVSKWSTYLQSGVGLVLVDVVTERVADLHRVLLERLEVTETGPELSLSATAYRPVERDKKSTLDIWRNVLFLGQGLPTLPHWLRGGLCLPVDLEASYQRTCIEQKVQVAALKLYPA